MESLLSSDVGAWTLLFIGLAAAAGGAAQSVIGFGAAFTTVPMVALLAPQLLPGSVLVAILPLAGLMVWRHWADLHPATLARLSVGRVPGILVGATVPLIISARGLALAAASLLLTAVASSVRGWSLRISPRSEVAAGFISGMAGTATGLGGPPLALLYRSQSTGFLRATLATVWASGLVLGLCLLALTGQLTSAQLVAGALMATAMLLGMGAASPMVKRLHESTVQHMVLWWAGLGAALVLLEVALSWRLGGSVL